MEIRLKDYSHTIHRLTSGDYISLDSVLFTTRLAHTTIDPSTDRDLKGLMATYAYMVDDSLGLQLSKLEPASLSECLQCLDQDTLVSIETPLVEEVQRLDNYLHDRQANPHGTSGTGAFVMSRPTGFAAREFRQLLLEYNDSQVNGVCLSSCRTLMYEAKHTLLLSVANGSLLKNKTHLSMYRELMDALKTDTISNLARDSKARLKVYQDFMQDNIDIQQLGLQERAAPDVQID